MLNEPEQTDELRRLALQIAIQLPASVAEAHEVLAMATECLDQFLIEPAEAKSAWRRARRLGWGVVPPAAIPVPVASPQKSEPGVLAVALCCLVMLAVAVLAGQAAFVLFGAGAIAANLVAVTVIALLYGSRPALLSSAAAALATNLVTVPPVLAFSPPLNVELMGLAYTALIAIAVPWISRRRDRLRSASLAAVRHPVRALRSRAA